MAGPIKGRKTINIDNKTFDFPPLSDFIKSIKQIRQKSTVETTVILIHKLFTDK